MVLAFLAEVRAEERELQRRADEHFAQLRAEAGIGYE